MKDKDIKVVTPILKDSYVNHPPIGYVDIAENSEITLRIAKEFAINPDLYQVVLDIEVIKKNRKGLITDAKIIAVNLVPRTKQA